MKIVIKFVLILLVLTGLVFFYAGYIEPNRFVVARQTLFLPNWNENLNGFKIAVISDIHIGTGSIDLKKLNRIVQKTNTQNPDLILLLGDFDAKYIQLSGISVNQISEVLKHFKSKYGVIAILGNHDYKPEGIVKNILKNAQIPVLENESIFIYPDRQKIKVIGFKDLWHYKLNPEKVIGHIETPSIVLVHNPDIFPQIPDSISLTLSGHTHGGEIYLPFIGAPFIPSKFNAKYRKGYVVENNKHLYVTGGIGTLSGFRTFNPPEIVILTINKQTERNKIVNTPVKKNYLKNCFVVPQSLK